MSSVHFCKSDTSNLFLLSVLFHLYTSTLFSFGTVPRSRLSTTLQPNVVTLPFLILVLQIPPVLPHHLPLRLHHRHIMNIPLLHHRHHLLCLFHLPRMVVPRTPIRAGRVRRVPRLDFPACAAHSGDTAGMVSTIATHVVRMAPVQIALPPALETRLVQPHHLPRLPLVIQDR